MESVDISTISEYLQHSWCVLRNFLSSSLDSNLSIAFFSSLAGAFGGAIAAQRVIEKSKEKEAVLRELRSTKAAVMVSLSICNAHLALKRQHSLPLYEQFTKDREKAEDIYHKLDSGFAVTEPFHFTGDMKTFSAPSVPIDTLQNLVFNEISAHGKALSAVSFLQGAYAGLKEVLSHREKLIAKFHSKEISEKEFPYYYFGIKMPTGHINQEYPDLIDAIHSYINDVIFFSVAICEDLAAHGNQLRSVHKKLIKKVAEVHAPDFSGPKESGLIPPDSEYSSWTGSFKEASNK